MTDPSYDSTSAEECCKACGARFERGDDGTCNRCGPDPIKGGKAASDIAVTAVLDDADNVSKLVQKNNDSAKIAQDVETETMPYNLPQDSTASDSSKEAAMKPGSVPTGLTGKPSGSRPFLPKSLRNPMYGSLSLSPGGRFPARPNPLANVSSSSTPATAAGLKSAAQDNSKPSRSYNGEDSGITYKENKDNYMTGQNAAESLKAYSKSASTEPQPGTPEFEKALRSHLENRKKKKKPQTDHQPGTPEFNNALHNHLYGKDMPEKKSASTEPQPGTPEFEKALRSHLENRKKKKKPQTDHQPGTPEFNNALHNHLYGKDMPEKRAYGYSDDTGFIDRVPWGGSKSKAEVLARMAKVMEDANAKNLELRYQTKAYDQEGLSPEDAYKMVESLPDSEFTGEFGFGGNPYAKNPAEIPWSVAAATRDGSRYNYRKDPVGVYTHLYGGDDDHEYDEYGDYIEPDEEVADFDVPAPKKGLLGSLFGKKSAAEPQPGTPEFEKALRTHLENRKKKKKKKPQTNHQPGTPEFNNALHNHLYGKDMPEKKSAAAEPPELSTFQTSFFNGLAENGVSPGDFGYYVKKAEAEFGEYVGAELTQGLEKIGGRFGAAISAGKYLVGKLGGRAAKATASRAAQHTAKSTANASVKATARNVSRSAANNAAKNTTQAAAKNTARAKPIPQKLEGFGRPSSKPNLRAKAPVKKPVNPPQHKGPRPGLSKTQPKSPPQPTPQQTPVTATNTGGVVGGFKARAKETLKGTGGGTLLGGLNPLTGYGSEYATNEDGSTNWARLAQSMTVGGSAGMGLSQLNPRRMMGSNILSRAGSGLALQQATGIGESYGLLPEGSSSLAFAAGVGMPRGRFKNFGLGPGRRIKDIPGVKASIKANPGGWVNQALGLKPSKFDPVTGAVRKAWQHKGKAALGLAGLAGVAKAPDMIEAGKSFAGNLADNAAYTALNRKLEEMGAPELVAQASKTLEAAAPAIEAGASIAKAFKDGPTAENAQGLLSWAGGLMKNFPMLPLLLLSGGGAMMGGMLDGGRGAAIGGLGLPLMLMLASGNLGNVGNLFGGGDADTSDSAAPPPDDAAAPPPDAAAAPAPDAAAAPAPAAAAAPAPTVAAAPASAPARILDDSHFQRVM